MIVCAALFTVVAEVAVNPPSVVFTVIVAAPAPIAVTTPLALTDAIEVSDEAHVTAGVVALVGATAAVRAWVWPTFKLMEVGATVTPVTGTVEDPPLSNAPALMMPTPQVFAALASQAPPGNGVNMPEVFIRASTCAGLREGF